LVAAGSGVYGYIPRNRRDCRVSLCVFVRRFTGCDSSQPIEKYACLVIIRPSWVVQKMHAAGCVTMGTEPLNTVR
jgi:hypothetical protein